MVGKYEIDVSQDYTGEDDEMLTENAMRKNARAASMGLSSWRYLRTTSVSNAFPIDTWMRSDGIRAYIVNDFGRDGNLQTLREIDEKHPWGYRWGKAEWDSWAKKQGEYAFKFWEYVDRITERDVEVLNAVLANFDGIKIDGPIDITRWQRDDGHSVLIYGAGNDKNLQALLLADRENPRKLTRKEEEERYSFYSEKHPICYPPHKKSLWKKFFGIGD